MAPQNSPLQKLLTGVHIVFFKIRFQPGSAVIPNSSGTGLNLLLPILELEKD